MKVCHKCDNIHCVNPRHLFLGTQLDNVHDCIAKGRFKYHPDNTGTNNGRAKLDWDKVHAIRARHEITCAEFAKRFGVTDVAVCYARSGKTWKEKK